MSEMEDDLDRLLDDVYDLLRDQLLDSMFRVEKLEIACGIKSEETVLQRIPSLKTRAEIDEQVEALKTRITILEQQTGD